MNEWVFGFREPLALLLFIPLFFTFWFTVIRKESGAVVKSTGRLVSANYKNPGKMNIFLMKSVSVLLWSSLFLTALSISGPQLSKKSIIYLERGYEYFFVLDVSPSMAVADIDGETRLDAAKNIIKTIAAAGDNNYPGLVLFGRDAVAAVPPTSDHGGFITALERAEPMMLGDGTAIGTAIALAAYQLNRSGAERKIIFLLSDGGHNHGELPPLDAAALARDTGVKIFCYALGKTATGSTEVILDLGGGGQISGIITNSYQPQLLRDIADITGSFCYEDTGIKSIQSGIHALKSLETRDKKIETAAYSKDYAFMLLLPGVIGLIASMLFKTLIFKELIL